MAGSGSVAIDAIPTHVTEVVQAERISEHYVRVTVGGDGLAGFASAGPDDFVYVLLPPPGRRELTVGTDFGWTAYAAMDEADRPVGAYYTVLALRPGVQELDFDVFLHDEPGPASGWAPGATPGDPVALWGPRTAFDPPDEVDWWLLVADETGLPATARILEELPAEAVVRAVVEVPDGGERHDLAAGRPDVELRWLPRDGREPGTTTRLADAVRDLALPPGRPYVWGGAESRAMRDVRRYLRREVGIERERMSLTPYWRHRTRADDPDDAED